MRKNLIFNNCFCNLTRNNTILPNPGEYYENLYVKVPHSKTENLRLSNMAENITVEIIEINSNILENWNIEKFLKDSKVKRLVLNYFIGKNSDLSPDKSRFDIINTLEGVGFEHLAIDLYMRSINRGTRAQLEEFLRSFPIIKHISIYNMGKSYAPLDIPHEFMGYVQYHTNMWARGKDEMAFFEIATMNDRRYIGLGASSISRYENQFFKFNPGTNGDWSIDEIRGIKPEFIRVQDFIDRLRYLIELTDDEINKFNLIAVKEYDRILRKHHHNLNKAHMELINNLYELDF